MVVFKQTLEDAIKLGVNKNTFIFTPNPLNEQHIKLVGTWKEFIEQYKGIPRKDTLVIFFGISSIHQRIASFLTLSRLCQVVIVPDFNAESYPAHNQFNFESASDYPSNAY